MSEAAASARRWDWGAAGPLLAFLALVIFNLITQPAVFTDPVIWRNLIAQNVDIGLLALGMTVVIMAGGIDLSVGAMMALCGVVAAQVMTRLTGSPPEMAFLVAFGAAMAVGVVAGLANGLLVTWGRLAPFVATLVGLLVFRSLSLVSADGGTLLVKSDWLAALTQSGLPLPFHMARTGEALILPWSAFIFFGVALVIWLLMERTPFGKHVVAVGSNEQAARYAAVNVNRVRLLTYGLLGACTALGGLLYTARLESVSSSSAGVLMELDAIAAVVLGGTALTGGRGRIWGTVVGVLLLGLITNTLVVYSNEVSPNWQNAVKGIVILGAVMLQRKRM